MRAIKRRYDYVNRGRQRAFHFTTQPVQPVSFRPLVFLEKKRLWGGRYAIVVCRVVGKQFDVYYVSLLGMNRRGHLDQRSVFEASTCTYTSDNDDSVIPIFCWCAMLVDYGICMQKI